MITITALIAELRVLVGYLGEKGQSNWWSSEFFSSSAASFLPHIFAKTTFLAQYQGVTAAAAKVHDEAIGVGRIYHLFRLPISLEQATADLLRDASFVQSLQSNLANKDTAIRRLTELTKSTANPSAGPVSLGQMGQDLATELEQAASFYLAAFSGGIQTYPYIREVE